MTGLLSDEVLARIQAIHDATGDLGDETLEAFKEMDT